MLSIGNFSKICQASVKTLHHYDKIELMKPVFIDEQTGYRYYSEDQIGSMLLIQRLKRYGFTLQQIREFLACEDRKALFKMLEQQKRLLRETIEQTALVIREMESHLTEFERSGNIMGYQNNYEMQLKNTEDMNIFSIRQAMGVADYGRYYGQLFEQIGKKHLTPTGKVMSIHHSSEFNPESCDTELAVSITQKEEATRVLSGGLCVSTIHKGAYSSLSDGHGAIAKWIEKSGYDYAGDTYEIYLTGPQENLPVEEWETEIVYPVRKK